VLPSIGMGLAVIVMEFRFPSAPPTLEQVLARFDARCGVPGHLVYDGPRSATLSSPAIDASVMLSLAGHTIGLELTMDAPRYLLAQLAATLRDLGGTDRHAKTRPDPAWATRPWPSLGLARRLAIRHRGLPSAPLVLLWVPVLVLLAPVIVLSELLGAVKAWFTPRADR
jgi:hypothetical protein